MPNRDTPPRLIEAWLDFHREGLCRNLDAIFAFDGQGMEIWCRSEDNRDLGKLQKIVDPLRNSYNIELYITRPQKNGSEDYKVNWTNIPPSLAENRELGSYLRPAPGNPPRIEILVDSEGEVYTHVLQDTPAMIAADAAAANRAQLARLTVWANRVLENNRIMRQYAADISELLRVAFEPTFNAALRVRARDICRKHAKDMAKSIKDLKKDLSRAFPKTPKTNAESQIAEKSESSAAFPAITEMADTIDEKARVLSGRIYRFIYPEQHTVDLDELKRPGLIFALDALEDEADDFERLARHI